MNNLSDVYRTCPCPSFICFKRTFKYAVATRNQVAGALRTSLSVLYQSTAESLVDGIKGIGIEAGLYPDSFPAIDSSPPKLPEPIPKATKFKDWFPTETVTRAAKAVHWYTMMTLGVGVKKALSLVGINKQIQNSLLFSGAVTTPSLDAIGAGAGKFGVVKLLLPLIPAAVIDPYLETTIFGVSTLATIYFVLIADHQNSSYKNIIGKTFGAYTLMTHSPQFSKIALYLLSDALKGTGVTLGMMALQWYNNPPDMSDKIQAFPKSMKRCLAVSSIAERFIPEVPEFFDIYYIPSIARTIIISALGSIAYNSHDIISTIQEIAKRTGRAPMALILAILIELAARRTGNPNLSRLIQFNTKQSQPVAEPESKSNAADSAAGASVPITPHKTHSLYEKWKSITVTYLFSLIDCDIKNLSKQQLHLLHSYIEMIKHDHEISQLQTEFQRDFFLDLKLKPWKDTQERLISKVDALLNKRFGTTFIGTTLRAASRLAPAKLEEIDNGLKELEIMIFGVDFNKTSLFGGRRKEYVTALIEIYLLPYITLTASYHNRAVPISGLDLEADYSMDKEPSLAARKTEYEFFNDILKVIFSLYTNEHVKDSSWASYIGYKLKEVSEFGLAHTYSWINYIIGQFVQDETSPHLQNPLTIPKHGEVHSAFESSAAVSAEPSRPVHPHRSSKDSRSPRLSESDPSSRPRNLSFASVPPSPSLGSQATPSSRSLISLGTSTKSAIAAASAQRQHEDEVLAHGPPSFDLDKQEHL